MRYPASKYEKKNKVMQNCFICKTDKPFSEFSPSKHAKSGYRGTCKKCCNEHYRDKSEEGKIKAKKRTQEFHKKNKYYGTIKSYNLTVEQYEALLRENVVCSICSKPQEHRLGKLFIDHDHLTGKIRGLLCHRCNSAIGLFKEDIQVMLLAIKYLIKHK